MNRALLHLLYGRAFHELAAAQSALVVSIGCRLGLYDALCSEQTALQLAERSGLPLHLIDGWLQQQLTAGFITRRGDEQFVLSDEQRAVFASDGERTLAGGFRFAHELARLWSGADPQARLFDDAELAATMALLDPRKSERIIAALPSAMRRQLDAGADVTEVGCGDGTNLITLAGDFPQSRFRGVDSNAPEQSDRPNLTFHREELATLPDKSADLVLCIETLHEVREPLAFARALHQLLRDEGRLLLLEPDASAAAEAPVIASYYATLSFLHCAARGGADALGPRASADDYIALLKQAGFSSVVQLAADDRLLLEARA